MSSTFKLKSHVQEGQNFEDGQFLVDHLKGVRDIAVETNRMHGIGGDIENIIEIICMCHDFGKSSSYFQDYLKGNYNGELKNHGEISAYFAYYMLPEEWKLIGFMCVKRHHGNLEPDLTFFDTEKENLMKVASDIKKNIEELQKIYQKDIQEFFEVIKDDGFLRAPRKEFRKRMNKFSIEELVWLEYLWSLLLTGDKTQLIRGEAYKNNTNVSETFVDKYKEKLRTELVKKIPEIDKSELFGIRNTIYKEVIEGINKADINNNHIFSINVPTGTGKTISVYGGAFSLLERLFEVSKGRILPTIIYCIPFMSVIDQNYNVLEDILKENDIPTYEGLILKHHSMSELRYRKNENEEYKDYDARFCAENWQSTIITTTFVQLFDSIFKTGINGIGHRFHKLAGSIIILDEVQAIPPKYYKVIEEVFRVLFEKFNTYVIVVTATKPLLLSGIELVKSNREIFNKLNRIVIENHSNTPIYLEEFCETVLDDIEKNKDKSFLIVLNTVKSSLEVLNYLTENSGREILYLSTEIHPARRLEMIKMIKENKNTKYVLVSTQLIEAGVDLDFDIVYRDFSTVDSINQTAGRANRNGISGKGSVKLYTLINKDHNDKKYSYYIYPKSLLTATEKILKNKELIYENEIAALNDEYFKMVDELKSDDESEEIIQNVKVMNFKEIANSFKLIEDDFAKEDIIINYNDEVQKDLDIIEMGKVGYQEMINAWRRLNKYKVSIYKKDLSNINCYEAKGIKVVNREDYDENRGIKRKKYSIC